ncbi:MAG: hypothetical protein WBB39_04625 [Candidatus Saccharimonadales bacterium]
MRHQRVSIARPWLFWPSLGVVVLLIGAFLSQAPRSVEEALDLPSTSASAPPATSWATSPTLEPTTPAPASAAPMAQATATPPTAPTATQPSLFADPVGKPRSLTIAQDGVTIVAMNFAPRAFDARDPLRFSSPCGKVSLWDLPGWPVPGAQSDNKALITGHMRCGTTYYTLDKLRGSKTGAVLTVYYDAGPVVFVATEDATSIGKASLPNSEADLRNNAVAQDVLVTTCDSQSGTRADGHARNNVKQRFTRVA